MPCFILLPWRAAIFKVLKSTVVSFFFHSPSLAAIGPTHAPPPPTLSFFSPCSTLQFTLFHSFSSPQNHVFVFVKLSIVDLVGWRGESSIRIYGARRAPRARRLAQRLSLSRRLEHNPLDFSTVRFVSLQTDQMEALIAFILSQASYGRCEKSMSLEFMRLAVRESSTPITTTTRSLSPAQRLNKRTPTLLALHFKTRPFFPFFVLEE